MILDDLTICENGNELKNFFEVDSLYKNFAVGDLWKEIKKF